VIEEPVILVVDDSATVRKIVQMALRREGMSIVTAGDGLSALSAVADEEPDLILLDVLLPRMDGYHVCRIIREKPEYHHIPIIMLSGKDGLFDKVRGRLAGSSEYLTKPFDTNELVRSVRKHLANAPAHTRTRQKRQSVARMRRWA
jgi:twitching motility two-component system response regulator PilG